MFLLFIILVVYHSSAIIVLHHSHAFTIVGFFFIWLFVFIWFPFRSWYSTLKCSSCSSSLKRLLIIRVCSLLLLHFSFLCYCKGFLVYAHPLVYPHVLVYLPFIFSSVHYLGMSSISNFLFIFVIQHFLICWTIRVSLSLLILKDLMVEKVKKVEN